MKNSKKKEVAKQWELAKEFADSILREVALIDAGAPSFFVKEQEKNISETRKGIDNNVGASLIPFAMDYEITKRNRAAMISISLFGFLSNAVQNLDALYKRVGYKNVVENPFDNKEIDKFWREFRGGLENGHKEKAVEALSEILRFISGDLLWAKFPEIPDINPEDILEI